MLEKLKNKLQKILFKPESHIIKPKDGYLHIGEVPVLEASIIKNTIEDRLGIHELRQVTEWTKTTRYYARTFYNGKWTEAPFEINSGQMEEILLENQLY